MTRPQLTPACPGWQSDLPGPHCPPTGPLILGDADPVHLDDIYLEISRRSIRKRGLLVWFAILLTYLVIDSIWNYASELFEDLETIILLAVAYVVSAWICAILFRVDISPPREEPIRFNRQRQRIYAYNFVFRWWNPFERWRVVTASYDWSQVRAESWKTRGTTAQGALIITWGVVLSIVEPGTNKVIDRFPLNTMGTDEFAWTYIRAYMQQGPSAVPPPGPPCDHHNVPWYNIARRMAPKVNWPAAMDLESRSAP